MPRIANQFVQALLATTAAILLASCGGGGSSGAPTPTSTSGTTGADPNTPSGGGGTAIAWEAGKFDPEAGFKNRCAVPRTTTDINGNPYPDVAGSTAQENFWLRSWSNRTYLWYNEITDRDPNLYNSRLEYFDLLKTFATTASGTPKDQFHFSIPTDEYEQLVSSGASGGYGAEFVLLQTSPPRDIRVAFTEPGTPAAAGNNLIRGTKILEIDGVDAVNGGSTQAELDVLNNGLFPSGAGKTTTLVVQDPGATTTRTVTLTSEIIQTQPVTDTEIIDTPTGKVGYIHFTTFGTNSAEAAIRDAMDTMQTEDVNDLVLDLRYNGGGFLAIAGQIGYMVAGDTRTNGRVFDRLTFNDKFPDTNPVTGQALSPTPFIDEGVGFSVPDGQDLPTLDLPRVFILSTDGTCSASEAVINGLRGIDVEVILIGTRTCGKPYGFYATDNCGETYFTVQFRGSNDKGFGDYADGFQASNASSLIGTSVPGCEIPDDFDNQLGDSSEALLAAALQYREDGTCPGSMIVKPSAEAFSKNVLSDGLDLMRNKNFAQREFLNNSRIENLNGIDARPIDQNTTER